MTSVLIIVGVVLALLWGLDRDWPGVEVALGFICLGLVLAGIEGVMG